MTPNKSSTHENAPHALPAPTSPTPERLALRLNEVAVSLGMSRRTIERLRSAGRFPKPDHKVGKVSLWSPTTIRRWVEQGGN